eukprot:CAMPEP_0179477328 /NCGR_PEP_ID=MMETSP0799-20121207/56091_1 /TAXON_ID=46947 /ORGANISM="Geminigera cryophila, Strain CCMP2564" /LENGTH=46 /DNA_ID= /DNA_START= /DNA_END= /DNA_ORIENTATION=
MPDALCSAKRLTLPSLCTIPSTSVLSAQFVRLREMRGFSSEAADAS